MSDVSLLNPVIVAPLVNSARPFKVSAKGPASKPVIENNQDGQLGEFFRVLGEVSKPQTQGEKKHQGANLPKSLSDEREKKLLIGLIHRTLVSKKDAFLKDQLTPEANKAYMALLELYRTLVTENTTELFPSADRSEALENPQAKMPQRKIKGPVIGIGQENQAFLGKAPQKERPSPDSDRAFFIDRPQSEKSLAHSTKPNPTQDPNPLGLARPDNEPKPLRPKDTQAAPSKDRAFELLEALLTTQRMADPKDPNPTQDPNPLGLARPDNEPKPLRPKDTQAAPSKDRAFELLEALLTTQRMAEPKDPNPTQDPNPLGLARPEPKPLRPKDTQAAPSKDRAFELLEALVTNQEKISGLPSDTKADVKTQILKPHTLDGDDPFPSPMPSSRLQKFTEPGDKNIVHEFKETGKIHQTLSFKEPSLPSEPLLAPKNENHGILKQLYESTLNYIGQDRPMLAQKHTLEIALDPPDLGRLLLHMDLKGSELKVAIMASTHEASQLLKQGYLNLQQSLQDHGIDLTQFFLSVGNPGSFAKEFEEFMQDTPNARAIQALGHELKDVRVASAPISSHQGILSIHV